jgi:succinate dehydrogenase/fumarate reductase flavoprotein subunit
MWLNVKKREINVMFETPAIELCQDIKTREILGVIAEQGGKQVYVKARKAVILCTGGFEANREMLADYYGICNVYNLGSPYDTGDGIKMLMKVGADLWHMRNPTTTGGLWIVLNVPGHSPFFRNLRTPKWSWIEVAKDGTRFYNEAYHWALRHMHMEYHGGIVDSPHFQCLPVSLIFDEETRKAAPIVEATWMGWAAIMEDYRWSDDNSREVEAGWITKAESIGDLAMKLGIDQKALRETVTAYNKLAEAGEVDEFGREPEMMAPIKNPPYYGIHIWPSVVTTTGGGRRDKEARVLDVDGNPIPRLYEAGECGSTLANIYQNGSFLTECVVFGRIAAKNATAEKPWT